MSRSSDDPIRPMPQSAQPRLFRRYWAVVWLAGTVVPSAQRAAWRNERRARLWHWAQFLAERDRPSSTNRAELAHWAWRQFAEAVWTRLGREASAQQFDNALRSPRLPLAASLLALSFVVLLSGFLPITRSLVMRLPYGNTGRVGLGSYVGSFWGSLRSTVPNTWVNVWQSQNTTLDGIAEYAFLPHLPGRDASMVVGQVSADFFDVLGVGAQFRR